jgi:hypothetical protein
LINSGPSCTGSTVLAISRMWRAASMIGEGERVLSFAIEQKFTGVDGELELLTSGSTRGRADSDACGHLQSNAV